MSRYPIVQPKFSIVLTWKQPSPAYSEDALVGDVEHRLRIEIAGVVPRLIQNTPEDRRTHIVTFALVRADTINVPPETEIKPGSIRDYAQRNSLRMTTVKQGLGALERYIAMQMSESLVICHSPVALPRFNNARKMGRYRMLYTRGMRGPRVTVISSANYNHWNMFLFEV